MADFEPTTAEMAQRVRELEQNILNMSGGRARTAAPRVDERRTTAPSPVNRAADTLGTGYSAYREEFDPAQTHRPQTSNSLPSAMLDPENTEILAINLVSGQIMTTFGNFELNEVDTAQAAMVGHEVVRRNLQEILNSLGDKYGMPQLRESIAQHEKLIREKIAQASVPPAEPQVPGKSFEAMPADLEQQVARIVRNNAGPIDAGGASFAEVLTDEADEIDEENDLPPVPTNKRRPRRR